MLIGRRKAPKAVWLPAREDRTTRGLLQARSSLEPSAHQQSHPAHVVVGAGIFWRTSAHKGSPFLRRRAPASNTADHEGSPGGSQPGKSSGDPSQRRKIADQQNAPGNPGHGSWRSYLQAPQPGTAERDAHTDRRRRCALGVPQGVRDMGHAADGGHGSRGEGSIRSLCGRCCSGVGGTRRRAWTRRFRPAACLCSRGSDCMTRRGRSYRCAGASERRTAGKRVRGES